MKTDAAVLSDAIEDVDIVGESVALIADSKTFRISSSSDLQQADVEISPDENTSIEAKAETKAKYSIEYLKKMIQGAKLSEKVTLQFAKDYPLKLDFTMPLLVRDLDRDGRADLSITHVGKGTTRIYRNGRSPAKALQRPAASIRVKGVSLFAYFSDLNGDGLDDLILPRLDKISLWTIIKVFITRSVPVEVLVYFQRKSGFFAREPDVVRELETALEHEVSPERAAILHFFAADALEHAGDLEPAIDHYIAAGHGGFHPRRALLAADRISESVGAVERRAEALQALVDVEVGPERARSLRAEYDRLRAELEEMNRVWEGHAE